MPNDDLGQFPTPNNAPDPQTSSSDDTVTQSPPPTSDTSILEDINTPAPDTISDQPFTTPPILTTPSQSEPQIAPNQADTFEETPEEIPSVSSPITPIGTPEDSVSPSTKEEIPAAPPTPVEPPYTPQPPTESTPAFEAPAPAIVPKGGSSFGSLIAIVLLLVAGIAIAATVFLFSQSQQLRQQLFEITQTLEKQKTTITPSPTPSIIEFTTPSPTPEATISATPMITLTPSPTASPSAQSSLTLANASRALKVAINHLPNAQLILIKTENATNPQTISTKYFFRQDLTTKKYFYVRIVNADEPEIVDKAIYVTPDNNIPSLNDLVLGNKLGIDMDQALKIANDLCTSGVCATATVKAQYIKSGENLIWQLSFDPSDSAKETLIIQINAETKAVLYKSSGF